MTTAQITITYTAAASRAAASNWLHLEQQAVPLSQRNATLADMVQMFNRAVSGASARSYQIDKCKAATITADGTIVVSLEVFVWPSALDLPYALNASYGSVDDALLVELEREVDMAVENSAVVTLPCLVGSPTAWWQIACVNEWSEPVESPAISIEGADISLSTSCYGVLRVRGLARGYRHTVTMEFAKAGNIVGTQDAEGTWTQVSAMESMPMALSGTPSHLGYTITGVDVSVTATYTDAEGAQQAEILTLTLPGCVLDLLETCDDGTLAVQSNAGDVVSVVRDDPIPTVYYDTCTGNVLLLRYEPQPKKVVPGQLG